MRVQSLALMFTPVQSRKGTKVRAAEVRGVFISSIKRISLLGAALVCLLLLSVPGFAQVRIIDCKGNTRAMSQESLGNTDIRVDVVDATGQPVNGAELQITNGELTLKGIADSGIVTFKDVAPGVWQLGASQTNIFFTSISLLELPPPGFFQQIGIGATEIVQGAIIVGAVVGAAVIVDKTSDSGGGGDSDEGGSTPPPSTCMTCNPDQAAPSIPPFN